MVNDYKRKNNVCMSFLKQKAKVSWLKDDDDNSIIFH